MIWKSLRRFLVLGFILTSICLDATSPLLSYVDQSEIVIDVEFADDKELEISDDMDDYTSEALNRLCCFGLTKKQYSTINHGFERIHQNDPAPPPERH